jgi:hypothetical protein
MTAFAVRKLRERDIRRAEDAAARHRDDTRGERGAPRGER